jgi:probable F420-dependent oxidoreductase
MAKVKLGTNLPEHLIGKDRGALVEFLAAIVDLGYSYVTVGDHVLGADLSVRPEWRPYQGKPPIYDHRTPWHEPMVLFGYLCALNETIEFATGILVSPQRQTALLAKQAAEVDLLSGGRLRLVVATGWNDVEYEALGVDFRSRGKIMEEQVALLRRLWSDEVVTYQGRFHTVTAAGINPLPVQRPIPLWFGGTSAPVLERVGRMGDGWFPHYPFFIEDQVHADIEVVRQSARAAGRDPNAIGIEAMILFYDERFDIPPGADLPPKSLEECVTYARTWKELGATHYWVTAPWADLGPEETGVRVPGKKWSGIETRVTALRDFKDAVGPDY